MQPEALVQEQLDAYNAHDIDRFLAVYSEDVKVIRHPSAKVTIHGKKQLREFYVNHRFNLPKLHAELVSRMIHGNKVIDQECVTGLVEDVIEVIAIYEIVGEHITTIWFLDKD